MTTTTRERGILFSGPMVRAILEGRKTQTRRVVKFRDWSDGSIEEHENGFFTICVHTGCFSQVHCPYGQPGDRLWVRETWQQNAMGLMYRADGESPESWRPSIHMPRWACRLVLEVTAVRVERLQEISEEDARSEGVENRKAQSFYLGIRPRTISTWAACSFREAFCLAWDMLNRKRATWESNPWVWVVDFEKAS